MARPSQTGGRSVSYSVLRIADHTGAVRYEAVETVNLQDRQKEIQDAYLKAAREWKPGQDPKAPQQQPVKPDVRVWRSVMGGADAKERAEAVAVECRKKEKEGKEGKKPDLKPPASSVKGSTGPSNDPLPSVKKIPGSLVK